MRTAIRVGIVGVTLTVAACGREGTGPGDPTATMDRDVALFAADKLVITPMTDAWQARARQVDKLRKQIGEGKGVIAREDYTRRRWNEMRKGTLPMNASQAEQEILGAFDKWSRDARISVTSVRPQWKRGATSSAP